VIRAAAFGVLVAINEVPATPDDLDDAVAGLVTLTEAKTELGIAIENLADAIARRMDDKLLTAGGVTVEKHRKPPRRTNWDHDGLLRYVVDSRVVDESTGEIASTLEVLKKVYPLKGYNARFGALKALGIDPDEFAETEWSDRYTLRVHGA
jgi:hypothetical protein